MYKFTKLNIETEDFTDSQELNVEKIKELYSNWEVKEYRVTDEGKPAEDDWETPFYTHIITSPTNKLWTLKECAERIKNGVSLENRVQKEAADAFGLFNLLYNIRDNYYLPKELKHLEP